MSNLADLQQYFNVLHTAYDHNLSIGILRLDMQNTCSKWMHAVLECSDLLNTSLPFWHIQLTKL